MAGSPLARFLRSIFLPLLACGAVFAVGLFLTATETDFDEVKILPANFVVVSRRDRLKEEYELQLSNTSSNTIIVDDVIGSCQCSNVTIDRNELRPGDVATILCMVEDQSIALVPAKRKVTVTALFRDENNPGKRWGVEGAITIIYQ